ncbi:ABC transporter substrate-binding protein [Sinomonas atrocyanea]|uniref:ABC transporter substrate-binding protein n=1 Tax=Sinomonas atrocyanea TaxID=37927 RepID=UPI002787A749|nr:ABC transporter substrate-binding protein [Sinomonas atrocyanea]MDQ0259467.1 ABC-type branched-subunit amino acid transport system substrate-binding protein [Sinomonas atrocyanea]MDR6621128.1 ABC-type branched-subunit amino acid transport system substrate-binding protein [Sinomonas atrocyanea]
MNVRKGTRGLLGAVAMASVLALSLTGCRGSAQSGSGGTAASPGITDTSITLGITTPLSGATAGPGTCTVAGVKAYFGAKNAEGGVKFGDGKTRKVDIKTYDDAYDPQKSLSNFQQMVSDNVFAEGVGLGTPTNRAFREAAISQKVPQVLVMTGDPTFSDQKQSPWQLGLVPAYQNEGGAFGKLLASSGGTHKVAILSQNDDYGKGYVSGFKDAIKGASNISVVGEQTYEATDTSVDAQITQLAATGADVFFNAMSITPLTIATLQKAQQIGWKPSWFLPSNTSSPTAILQPGGASAYPGIYSVAFSKAPQSPEFAKDQDVVKFLSDLKQYANYQGMPAFPHCMWSYIAGATLDQAFQKMTDPTRDSFMKALRSIKGFNAPLMLQGTSVDTTMDGQPAISSVLVQKYNGKGYATAQKFG